MIKEIKYGGYSVNPPDYECSDGDLTMSLNAINEDGAIRGLKPPAIMQNIGNRRLVLIHSVPGHTNYILAEDCDDGTCLSYIDSTETDVDNAVLIKQVEEVVDIKTVGNMIVAATKNGLRHILWKGEAYKFLGERPPFLPISFGAYKKGELLSDTSTVYTDVPPHTLEHYSKPGYNQLHIRATEEDSAFWGKVCNQALGLLFSSVADAVTSKGYFYQPFFVRYAYRLYDGSYCWHSAPVLMLVSSVRPVIYISGKVAGSESLNMTTQLSFPYFALAYRIFGDIAALKNWSDIVSGIDIFVSAPIYTYNQDCKDSDQLYLTSKSSYYDNSLNKYSGFRRGRNPSAGEKKAYIGTYALNKDGDYIDRYFVFADNNSNILNLPENENFIEDLQHTSLFYKIASLDIDDLEKMSAMTDVPLIKTDLTNINTLEQLKDEYNSHAEVVPRSLFVYNRRLTLTGISITPPPAMPMCSAVQAISSTSTGSAFVQPDAIEKIRVFTRVNGITCTTEYSQSAADCDYPFIPYSECFPRYIYHPDASAFRMEITACDGNHYALPLVQHPFLNGAYWFGGLGETPVDVLNNKADVPGASLPIPIKNKVYLSEVDNPFIFPATGIVSVGSGEVYSLSSAAKALSQGQFGQFPLYAFTNEGVWALEISQTGAIVARQPITRDVCDNIGGITQIDSAVIFPTARGIMLISGSQTQCISDLIDTDIPFDLTSMPGMSELHDMLSHDNAHPDSCLSILPFSEFLDGCGMLYDYPHQHIIVYNADYSYAYVFSLESKSWGMMYSDVKFGVNSYPEALAIDNSGNIVNFSKTVNGSVGALMVTRPMKLDNPDILKTVSSVVCRGHFRSDRVKIALYGSRDMFSWYLIGSSRNHRLKGFRGTPYKYFRLAIVADLDTGESLSGVSMQFLPRYTGKLR